jgi:hypothetical protein
MNPGSKIFFARRTARLTSASVNLILDIQIGDRKISKGSG